MGEIERQLLWQLSGTQGVAKKPTLNTSVVRRMGNYYGLKAAITYQHYSIIITVLAIILINSKLEKFLEDSSHDSGVLQLCVDHLVLLINIIVFIFTFIVILDTTTLSCNGIDRVVIPRYPKEIVAS